MPRLSKLVSLALCLASVATVSLAQQTSICHGEPTTFASAGTFNTPFLPGTGVVVTEQNNPSGFGIGGQPITGLSVTLAAASGCGVQSEDIVKSANIMLGLYSSNALGTELTLLTHTDNFNVPIGEIITGGTIQLPVVFNQGNLVDAGQSYFIGFGTDSAQVCLQGVTGTQSLEGTTPVYAGSLPSRLPVTGPNEQFEASSTVCVGGTVSGDPVFTGFNGQQFMVKGAAGKVFNLISSPAMSFNNRFISLATEADSMTAAAMKEVRAQFTKQSKLAALVKSAARPPVTTAWSHAGTYMGESGITLGDSQLYVAPGAYATGFSSIQLDGKDLPISNTPLELDGDITVTHPSAFKVIISTPSVRFTLVNADNFVNIEHARVLSADNQLTGLLGQTADAEFEVVDSAEFTQHIENDYLVASNKLF